MNDNLPGCLGFFVNFFDFIFGGAGRFSAPRLPYRLRDDFLSQAELRFYRVLVEAVDQRAVICCKVNLADLFFVVEPETAWTHRNKINRKHVDFLLCDLESMEPLCGIELDDSSHARPDRQERDELVSAVFEAANLPLLRVPVRSVYVVAALAKQIESCLREGTSSRQPAVASADTTPRCQKCGVAMVVRVTKRGENIGQRFFGCVNYPRCREIVRIGDGTIGD